MVYQLCDNEIASHRFVADLADTVINNVIVPEARRTGTLPLTEEDLEFIEGLVKDAVRALNKSELAVIKTGTFVRRPDEAFQKIGCARWLQQLISLHLGRDCCTADRLLASLLMTVEILVALHQKDLFRFKDHHKSAAFKQVANQLLFLRERKLSPAAGSDQLA